MELAEFAGAIEISRTMPHNHTGHHAGAVYYLSQFHMLTGLDDVGNFRCKDIMVNLEYKIRAEI